MRAGEHEHHRVVDGGPNLRELSDVDFVLVGVLVGENNPILTHTGKD